MSTQPEAALRMDVLFSPEDAALIHAFHDRYGFYLTVGEMRLRDQAERAGFGHLLAPPVPHNP